MVTIEQPVGRARVRLACWCGFLLIGLATAGFGVFVVVASSRQPDLTQAERWIGRGLAVPFLLIALLLVIEPVWGIGVELRTLRRGFRTVLAADDRGLVTAGGLELPWDRIREIAVRGATEDTWRGRTGFTRSRYDLLVGVTDPELLAAANASPSTGARGVTGAIWIDLRPAAPEAAAAMPQLLALAGRHGVGTVPPS